MASVMNGQCSKPRFVELVDEPSERKVKAKQNVLIKSLCTFETTALLQVKGFNTACAVLPALYCCAVSCCLN